MFYWFREQREILLIWCSFIKYEALFNRTVVIISKACCDVDFSAMCDLSFYVWVQRKPACLCGSEGPNQEAVTGEPCEINRVEPNRWWLSRDYLRAGMSNTVGQDGLIFTFSDDLTHLTHNQVSISMLSIHACFVFCFFCKCATTYIHFHCCHIRCDVILQRYCKF